MTKRLKSLVLSALLLVGVTTGAMADGFAAPQGEVLLTITGSIAQTNSGAELLLDQAQLAALPQTSFTTSTTWTSGTPMFQGVLLSDLVAAIGATGGTVTLTAANDYAVSVPMSDIGKDAPLLAYLMNGEPMSLRDKGPVWMVYPYDADEKYRTGETFARSIWQLVRIDFAP